MSKTKNLEMQNLNEDVLTKRASTLKIRNVSKTSKTDSTVQVKPAIWEGGHSKSITYTTRPLSQRSGATNKNKKRAKQSHDKDSSIKEISVESMNLHKLQSTKSLAGIPEVSRMSGYPRYSGMSFVDPRKSVQLRKPSIKRKQKFVPKLTAHAMYTNKVLQQTRAKQVGDPETAVQYRPQAVQQSIRTVREEMKSKLSLPRSRKDSDTSIIAIKNLSISSSTRLSRRKSRAKSRKASRFHIVAPKSQSVSSAKMQESPTTQKKSISTMQVENLSTTSMSKRSASASTISLVDSPQRRKSAKFRSFTKRKRTPDNRIYLINKSLEQFRRFQVAGVRALQLTESTQDVLGINEKINLEIPWFHLEIDDILDKINQVKTYSEILNVLEVIVPYVGQKILVGYFPYPSMFLVCTTPEAEDRVLTMIEEDLIRAYEMLETKLCRTSFRWLSFGSEKEIDVKDFCFRPLYRITISLIYPIIHQEDVRFTMRLVQDARDGYVELLSLRQTFDNIYKRKIDASSQTSISNISIGTQFGNHILRIIGTQYFYSFQEQQLTNLQYTKLNLFLKQEYTNIEATILENTFMQIYKKDYKTSRSLVYQESPKDLVQFWEAKYCKRKTASLVVWNPWVSGNIAVIYSEINNVVQRENLKRTNQAEQNYILIWDYSIQHAPEQYLFSEKVITTVSFSPQDRRMVIGGCETGDILVWYLPKVELETNQEILSEKMYNNRQLMKKMSSWIKNLDESRNIIKPKAFSSTQFSHLGQVNCIKWMLPKYKFMSNAKLMTVEKGEEVFQQFLSCGVDGHVLIWDVPKLNLSGTKNVGNKLNRYANILKEKILVPRCRMSVSLSTSNCLTFIYIPNQKVKFDVVQHVADKVLFESKEDPENEMYSSNIYLSTSFGAIVTATWDEYEHILKENHGNTVVSPIIHDGPISSFEVHPIDSDFALSVGGKIFAVWFLPKLQKPVFWRKRDTNLVAGFWSLANAEELTVATFDAKLETWNFLEDGPTPLKTINVSKYPINSLFNDISTEHAHKSTLAITDFMGSVKVVTVPEDAPPEMLTQQIRQNLRRDVKKILDKRQTLKERLCPEQIAEVVPKQETEECQTRKPKRGTEVFRIKKVTKESLESRQEHRVALQKEKDFQDSIEIMKQKYLPPPGRKINQYLEDEENFRKNLPCLKKNQEIRQKMLKEKLTARNSIVKKSVDNILSQEEINFPKKMIDIQISEVDREIIKRKYLAEYRNMERPTLNFIKWNTYDEEINWMDFMDRGKRKLSGISAITMIQTIMHRGSTSSTTPSTIVD